MVFATGELCFLMQNWVKWFVVLAVTCLSILEEQDMFIAHAVTMPILY